MTPLTIEPKRSVEEAGAPIVVRQLSADDEIRWDAFVQNCPEATFFHLAGWRKVIERAFGHPTYYLLAERTGIISGVLPLTHIKSILFGNSLVSNAFCVYGGPVASDDASRVALEREAIRTAERIGAGSLELRTIDRTHDDWPCRGDLYVTFRKPIMPDVDANMKAIPRKQRAMVRKGIQNGLHSIVDEGVSRLHRVYAESVHNLGTPVFPKTYFRALKEEFKDRCDIVTVLKDEKPVASVLNFYFRDEVLPYYGGGTSAARDLAANDFMYWEVMRRACEKGCTLFDFGRSKINTGAYAFKKYWGFPATALNYQYWLAPGQQMPDLNPLNPKYKLMINIWKRLPLGIASLLGPRLARDLG
jgi:FemAB-related protein (PEP-CTERM system-associated)